MKRAVHHSAVWLVFPLWALFVAIAFGRVALLLHYNHDFLAQAKSTEGTVIKKMERRLDHFSGDRVYILVYTYDAGNIHGQVRNGVDPETFNRVKTGGPIPIAYLPSDPRHHCINFPWELADLNTAPLDDFVVAMFAFVPGLGLVWYFGRRNRIHRQLMTQGVHVWGEVTEVKKTHTRQGSHTYLIFRFTTATEQVIEGRTSTLSDAEPLHWRQGDPIQVFYDRRNPQVFAVDLQHPLDGLDTDEPAPAPFWQTIFA